MKYLFLSLIAVLLLSSCDNGNTGNDNTKPTDDTVSMRENTPPEEEPKPETTSPYEALNTSTYVGEVEGYQADLFLNFVTPKQKESAAPRTDTLYSVSYLPYKDQEIYIYRTVENGTLNQWCVAIMKNGEILVDEVSIATADYTSVTLNEMQVGDKEMTFTGTNLDNTMSSIVKPYDGKELK